MNDSTEIELYATLSNKSVRNKKSYSIPTFRTRLFIRSNSLPKAKSKPNLSEENIKNLDVIANGFFYAMRSKEIKENETLLKALISSTISINQLEQLQNYFNFKDELELISYGIQQGADGSAYTMLQYKHVNDKNSPPKEILKLLFGSNNKIVGIRPLRIN